MIELGLIALLFLALFISLLAINYKAFTEYPDRLTERWLGRDILESKGPRWFIITKAAIFLVPFVAFLTLTPLIPTRYSYLIFGVLLGVVSFNIIHDYMEYTEATKVSKKGRLTYVGEHV